MRSPACTMHMNGSQEGERRGQLGYAPLGEICEECADSLVRYDPNDLALYAACCGFLSFFPFSSQFKNLYVNGLRE